MTAPNGTLIANLVPGIGGETGILMNNNNLKAEARVFYQFVDDGKYMFIDINGIAPPGDAYPYQYQCVFQQSSLRDKH